MWPEMTMELHWAHSEARRNEANKIVESFIIALKYIKMLVILKLLQNDMNVL